MAERVANSPGSAIWPEHRSRYRFAAQLVRGRRLLDVACGTGLGLDLLAGGGPASLVGCDLSDEALDAARPTARAVGASLVRADATSLPVPDAGFDVVASFETLEHVPDAERLLDELVRVLAGDGELLVSTPNALVTKPVDGRPRNPWHVRELEPDEFGAMLADRFGDVEVLGQRCAAAYGRCPMWEPVNSSWDQARLLAWRIGHRAPPRVRDGLWARLRGRPYFPGEDDFEYTTGGLERAHVLVARCRSPRRR